MYIYTNYINKVYFIKVEIIIINNNYYYTMNTCS